MNQSPGPFVDVPHKAKSNLVIVCGTIVAVTSVLVVSLLFFGGFPPLYVYWSLALLAMWSPGIAKLRSGYELDPKTPGGRGRHKSANPKAFRRGLAVDFLGPIVVLLVFLWWPS